jgi:hypothetical protein
MGNDSEMVVASAAAFLFSEGRADMLNECVIAFFLVGTHFPIYGNMVCDVTELLPSRKIVCIITKIIKKGGMFFMVIFCLMLVSIFGAFIAMDIYISRVWDIFSVKSYDMVAGDRNSHPSSILKRGEEYRNKTRLLRNP